MSMICVLRQIEASEIDTLLQDPERIFDLLEEDNSLDEDELEAETDLDKAWHGIHYLLTGTAWEGKPPLCYLVGGGQTIGDVEVSYGPARVLRPDEVRAFDQALKAISLDDLSRRFNPDAMMRAEIYPEIWDRNPGEDDTLAYVLEYFEPLKVVLHDAAQQKKGLIIYFS